VSGKQGTCAGGIMRKEGKELPNRLGRVEWQVEVSDNYKSLCVEYFAISHHKAFYKPSLVALQIPNLHHHLSETIKRREIQVLVYFVPPHSDTPLPLL